MRGTGTWRPGRRRAILSAGSTLFIYEIRDFAQAISDGRDPEPSFEDSRSVRRVLDGVVRSEAEDTWIDIAKAA